ncbi:alpha/beta fold hydrolase [Castellaniella sp.]|uniref:alpha/beta fold hydrolase n=1 Tax=Castellaniella sp. TaxID=1955812 RepID=UPI0035656F39
MFITSKDRSIYYQLDGNAQGPRLVLLNSLGTSLGSWNEVVAILAGKYHLLRIDKSGHGQSASYSGELRISDNAADVLAVMDAVSWDKANVCGVSIGGMTILDLAIHHPHRLDKIILSNTSSYVSPEHLIERAALIRKFGIAFVAAQVVGRFFIESSTVSSNERFAVAVRDFLACDDESYCRWCEAIVAMDYRPGLHQIDAQTLVITGEHDKATPAHMGQHLHQAIYGAERIHLPYGHIPYMDDAQQYADILDRFLSGRQPASAR